MRSRKVQKNEDRAIMPSVNTYLLLELKTCQIQKSKKITESHEKICKLVATSKHPLILCRQRGFIRLLWKFHKKPAQDCEEATEQFETNSTDGSRNHLPADDSFSRRWYTGCRNQPLPSHHRDVHCYCHFFITGTKRDKIIHLLGSDWAKDKDISTQTI